MNNRLVFVEGRREEEEKKKRKVRRDEGREEVGEEGREEDKNFEIPPTTSIPTADTVIK